MVRRKSKPERDIEKTYPLKLFIAKLRRLADSLEQGRRFQIQIGGERLSIPPDAVVNIEHEREGVSEEVEFQLKWQLKQ
ncbi:MAG: amphi-Trp domain-containing protein [Desulfobacterales bacterium]|jgi:amphi-Trp domain-containing protein|nr:amphi-Trp domain-containing protein [Desulfobacterales bacterium]